MENKFEIDVTSLKNERVEYLKNLVDLWKRQDTQNQHKTNGTNPEKQDIVFATHKSRVIGGKTIREMAYENE